jgi:hypothetical protein
MTGLHDRLRGTGLRVVVAGGDAGATFAQEWRASFIELETLKLEA